MPKLGVTVSEINSTRLLLSVSIQLFWPRITATNTNERRSNAITERLDLLVCSGNIHERQTPTPPV